MLLLSYHTHQADGGLLRIASDGGIRREARRVMKKSFPRIEPGEAFPEAAHIEKKSTFYMQGFILLLFKDHEIEEYGGQQQEEQTVQTGDKSDGVVVAQEHGTP